MLTADDQQLLEAIQKGICIVDSAGIVQAANGAFLQLAQLERGMLLGACLGDFLINLSPAELYAKLPLQNIALRFPNGAAM